MAETTVTFNGREETFPSKKVMLRTISGRILADAAEPMTLRQLYYRFVGNDLIENKQSQYQYLGEAVKEARIDGKIPWSWIEDRTRSTDAGDHNDGEYITPNARFQGNLKWFRKTADRFRRPRWENQPNYVEVWVEKEALAGVFATVCDDLCVVSFPNRGYTSITMLKQAAERIRDETAGTDREAHILYFGDFDPSGQDIERNIREKLSVTFGVDVSVERFALTRAQIDKYELPPQPAKTTDARYESFVAEHGDMAVELDALPPARLRELIREAVNDYFDSDVYEGVQQLEEADTNQLASMIDDALTDEVTDG